jgi:hypothetical protein
MWFIQFDVCFQYALWTQLKEAVLIFFFLLEFELNLAVLVSVVGSCGCFSLMAQLIFLLCNFLLCNFIAGDLLLISINACLTRGTG